MSVKFILVCVDLNKTSKNYNYNVQLNNDIKKKKISKSKEK